jgi:hypothetical protein
VSARNGARADDAIFADGGRAPNPLPLAIGDRVEHRGKVGVIEAVAFSVATERRLITVAFGPRMRFTLYDTEVTRA